MNHLIDFGVCALHVAGCTSFILLHYYFKKDILKASKVAKIRNRYN